MSIRKKGGQDMKYYLNSKYAVGFFDASNDFIVVAMFMDDICAKEYASQKDYEIRQVENKLIVGELKGE